ncbi:hypothetical protein HDE_13771 [Halotydeus destructor]|nr:hypothetical protein HDE_13771 [Halotydeus destructor]
MYAFCLNCSLCSRTLQNVPFRAGRLASRRFSSKRTEPTVAEEMTKVRKNEIGIQMISEPLRQRLFGDLADGIPKSSQYTAQKYSGWSGKGQDDSTIGQKSYRTHSVTNLCSVKEHLTKHGFWDKKIDKPTFDPDYVPEIFIDIPQLEGKECR